MQPQHLSIVLALFIVTLAHTVEPHHWLPFALVGRGQNWSMSKTLAITALSGLGKSLVSVGLGIGVVFLGLQITKYLEYGEVLAGGMLLLMGLGFIIFAKRHNHNIDSSSTNLSDKTAIVSLFTLAISSPCVEPLPIFLAASTFEWPLLLLMAATLTLANLIGIVFLTALAYKGTQVLRLKWLEMYEKYILGVVLILIGMALISYHFLFK